MARNPKVQKIVDFGGRFFTSTELAETRNKSAAITFE